MNTHANAMSSIFIKECARDCQVDVGLLPTSHDLSTALGLISTIPSGHFDRSHSHVGSTKPLNGDFAFRA